MNLCLNKYCANDILCGAMQDNDEFLKGLLETARKSSSYESRKNSGLKAVQMCIVSRNYSVLEYIAISEEYIQEVRKKAGLQLALFYNSECNIDALLDISANSKHLYEIREYAGMCAINLCSLANNLIQLSKITLNYDLPDKVVFAAIDELEVAGDAYVDACVSFGNLHMLPSICRNLAIPSSVRNKAMKYMVKSNRHYIQSSGDDDIKVFMDACKDEYINPILRISIGIKLIEISVIEGNEHILHRIAGDFDMPKVLRERASRTINDLLKRKISESGITKRISFSKRKCCRVPKPKPKFKPRKKI